MKYPDIEKINETPINFIIGMGRSGTTLLTSILNSNSSIISAPENNFILFGKDLASRTSLSKEELFNEFKAMFNLKHNHVISSWNPDFDFIKNVLNNDANNINYQTLCKSAYYSQNQKNEQDTIKSIVDKNPVYSLFIDDLIQLFPESKFIILVRDYRDNIASRKKFTNGIVSRTIYNLAHTWSNYYSQIEKVKIKFPDKFHVLKYEDLVTNPSLNIRELCEFLEIDFEENMLHPEKESNNYFNSDLLTSEQKERVSEMHKELSKPINSSKVTAWKDFFSKRELIIIETICNKFGKIYGYDKSVSTSIIRRFLIGTNLILISPLFFVLNKSFHGLYYRIPFRCRKKIFRKIEN